MDQHKESLKSRLETAHLEATKDGESDRESCASHRSQDSLDIDADLERASDKGGSQQDLQRFASAEELDQIAGSSELEQSDYPEGVEVTLQDCLGAPPPPRHLTEQQDDREVEQYTLDQPEIRIEEPHETDDADETLVEPPRDGEYHDQKLEPPGEGDADTTLQEGQSTATAHSPKQDIGMEEDDVGAKQAPNRPQQGHPGPLPYLQEYLEVGTGGQESDHSRSQDHRLQEMPAGEDAGQDQLADNSLEQGKLSVSVEATPYQVNEPVAMVCGSVRAYVGEKKCLHQFCWKGKIASQEGFLELEGGAGRSVRYPLQKQAMSTDPNSVQVAASIELDPGTLAVEVEEETSAVSSDDGVTLVAEACPTEAAEEEQLGLSTPIVEKKGSGVVVLKQDWRVQTVDDGTAFQCDWNSSMLLEPHPVLHIPGAAMV